MFAEEFFELFWLADFTVFSGLFAVYMLLLSVVVDRLEFVGACVCGGGLYAVCGVSVSVVVDCMQLVVCLCQCWWTVCS